MNDRTLARFAALPVVTVLLLAGCGGSSGGASVDAPAAAPDPIDLSLVRAVQDRDVDPSGATVALQFDHEVRAESASELSRFTASGGQLAIDSDVRGTEVLVTFHRPIVPGETTVDVRDLESADGTPMRPRLKAPIESTDTEPPQATSVTATAPENAGNDRLTLAFDDDMLPADVTDATHLDFEHPLGSPYDLTAATLNYDSASRILTVHLNEAPGGGALAHAESWRLEVRGMRDVAGNAIADTIHLGAVEGDDAGPTVLACKQNTTIDPSGQTVDITFSEVLDPTSAGEVTNFIARTNASAQLAKWASPILDGDIVRVSFPLPVVPSQVGVDVDAVADLAGNGMSASASVLVEAEDSIPPRVTTVTADTIAGILNDEIVVHFDENMLPGGAEAIANYTFETPLGTILPLGRDTRVNYDAANRATRIVLSSQSAPVYLTTGAMFRLTVNGVRDVAGNALLGAEIIGFVGGDQRPPAVLTGGVVQKISLDPSGRTVEVALDEPADPTTIDPLSFHAGGQAALWATPTGFGDVIRMTFDQPVPAGTTVRLADIRDLAGNQIAPGGHTVLSEEATPPTVLASTASSPTGAVNDTLTVQFSETVLPNDATDISNYGLESPVGTPVPLDVSHSVSYDQVTRTATLLLSSPTARLNLRTGADYKITVQNVRDVAGNAIGGGNTTTGTIAGDTTPPEILQATVVPLVSRVVEVVFSEEVDPDSVAASTWSFSQIFQTAAPGAASVGLDGRTVRVVTYFANTPGETIRCSGITDLAGNALDPTTPPLVTQ